MSNQTDKFSFCESCAYCSLGEDSFMCSTCDDGENYEGEYDEDDYEDYEDYDDYYEESFG